ncbi:MAG TPA: tetratricopeptide repeat protein [Candidatus Dormibacteraeota bacterium]
MAEVGEFPKSKIQAAEEAVSLALASRWQDALALNDDLLERFGADEDTSNRRGKALLELGRLDEAEAAYQATLAVNPGNQIARRQLGKLAERRAAKGQVAPVSASVDVAVFTDEPGKSAITKLILAEGVDASQVAPGDPINVEVCEDQVTVRTLRGVDLGGVEPRLSQRMLKLSRGGNRYAGAVTHVDGAGVQVILREVYQAPELAGTNSFPVRKVREISYRPYAKEPVIPRDEEPPVTVDDDDDPLTVTADPVADDLDEGLGEFEESADEAEPDDVDEDVRPEDEY